MGCDIHMLAEMKSKKSGKWKKMGRVFKSCYGDGELTDEPYDGRNYGLFAILADVRNGVGFAGVKTGSGYEPIDSPRGVPEDASNEYRELVEKWGFDGHSHSYFILEELLAYDWFHKKTKRIALVKPEEYKVFKKKGKPESCCAGASGMNVRIISNAEMEKRLKENDFDKGLSYYTQVSWTATYADTAEWFLEKTIPVLQKKSKEPDVDDVRIVFFFDN